MGMLSFRERREERDGGGREGRERDFLMEGGREMKESFVAFGSKRDCWERNESKPSIGAAVIVVVIRSMWRSTAVMVVGLIIVCPLGFCLFTEREREIGGEESSLVLFVQCLRLIGRLTD